MINVSRMTHRGTKGFTITELLVATAVFASVLLLAIVGFIQVGKLFYKGVTVSQTRQTASNIMDALSADIRLSTAVTNPPGMDNGAGQVYPETCIGGHLYTYNPGVPIDLANHDFSSRFGLIQSDLPGGACPQTTVTPADIKKSNPVEMLGDGMRLSNLSLTQSSTSAWQVTVTVTFGEDAVLNNPNNSDPPPSCKGIATGSQFCSVVTLNSTVSNRPSLGL